LLQALHGFFDRLQTILATFQLVGQFATVAGPQRGVLLCVRWRVLIEQDVDFRLQTWDFVLLCSRSASPCVATRWHGTWNRPTPRCPADDPDLARNGEHADKQVTRRLEVFLAEIADRPKTGTPVTRNRQKGNLTSHNAAGHDTVRFEPVHDFYRSRRFPGRERPTARLLDRCFVEEDGLLQLPTDDVAN